MIAEKLSSDGLNIETKIQNLAANFKYEDVIGPKRSCQYPDLPAFVRDMIDFKGDQDVVITHITDTRIELRINEAFKKIDEAAEKTSTELNSKMADLEELQKRIMALEKNVKEINEANDADRSISIEEDSDSELTGSRSKSHTSSSDQTLKTKSKKLNSQVGSKSSKSRSKSPNLQA